MSYGRVLPSTYVFPLPVKGFIIFYKLLKVIIEKGFFYIFFNFLKDNSLTVVISKLINIISKNVNEKKYFV